MTFPPYSPPPLDAWQMRQDQYTAAMRMALQAYLRWGAIPHEVLDPLQLADSVSKIMAALHADWQRAEAERPTFDGQPFDPGELTNRCYVLERDNRRLNERIDALMQTVNRLQERLDREKTSGKKGL